MPTCVIWAKRHGERRKSAPKCLGGKVEGNRFRRELVEIKARGKILGMSSPGIAVIRAESSTENRMNEAKDNVLDRRSGREAEKNERPLRQPGAFGRRHFADHKSRTFFNQWGVVSWQRFGLSAGGKGNRQRLSYGNLGVLLARHGLEPFHRCDLGAAIFTPPRLPHPDISLSDFITKTSNPLGDGSRNAIPIFS